MNGCFGAGMMLIPLGFVAGCCYVVYIYPVKMQKTDAKFLHAFAFLFFRFKPDAYWFTVILFFILRNLLAALVPTLLEPLFQVGVLMVLFGASLVVVAKYFPWRNEVANYIDILVTLNIVIMLAASGFFVDSIDESTAGIVFFAPSSSW